MSYCRFSEGDVYLYAFGKGNDDRYHCCSCSLSPTKDMILYSPQEALNHLLQHHLFGDFVPDRAFAELEEEMSLCAIGKRGRRTMEETIREHDEKFKAMQRFRAGVEGSISFLKRVFGMARCVNKGFKHFAITIGTTVFCHNLVILSRT